MYKDKINVYLIYYDGLLYMVFHLQGNTERKNKIMIKIMLDYCKLCGDNINA